MLLLCLNLVLFLFIYFSWRGERREDRKGRSCKRREDAKLSLVVKCLTDISLEMSIMALAIWISWERDQCLTY